MPDLGHSTDAPVNFRVEQGHAFAGGVVEVRRYFWTTPLRQTVDALSHALVLNMALTSRPIHTRVDRMNDQGDPLAGEAGRLLVMIPGVPYRLSAPSGALRSLHCAIDCERLEAMVGAPIDWQMLASFSGNLRDGAAIESCMTRIHDELVSNRIGRETAIEACIDLICVELARQFRHGRPAKPDVMRGGLAAWRMRAILNRTRGDGPAPRISELAATCGLTERQLSRAFKAETGMTLGRFIDEATIERAHRLLTTTDRSIAEIARDLGFASGDSFSRSYRHLTGALPSRIRRSRHRLTPS